MLNGINFVLTFFFAAPIKKEIHLLVKGKTLITNYSHWFYSVLVFVVI
jgi:hypothetical protein